MTVSLGAVVRKRDDCRQPGLPLAVGLVVFFLLARVLVMVVVLAADFSAANALVLGKVESAALVDVSTTCAVTVSLVSSATAGSTFAAVALAE